VGYGAKASKQHRQKRCELARKQRPLGKLTMADNDDNKRRRLVEFKDGCRYGKFGKTKAYELIAQKRIRAYKMGGKTMIDLDSVDEYHASLPRIESRAS
jgi:excisionase family DNA binding protein